jgi:succinate dehydrogenase / fumarate reductase, cytochrome b subunit
MSRYTLASSIFNRLTGLVLSVGLLLLVYWLMAIAAGPTAFARALRLLSLPAAKLAYAALTVAFCYHLIAGIRHLVWDTGHALERAQSRLSAYLVVAVSLALVLLIAWYAWLSGTRGP